MYENHSWLLKIRDDPLFPVRQTDIPIYALTYIQECDNVSCVAALGLVCMMTGLKLDPKAIIVSGRLLPDGFIVSDMVPEITKEYLLRVREEGYGILAIAKGLYDVAERRGPFTAPDADQYMPQRVELVSEFWELLGLVFDPDYQEKIGALSIG